MSWIDNVVKLIELKARYFLVLWILGALLIFLPISIKEPMGLANLPSVVQPWLGLATLASFAMWVTQLVQSIRNWFSYRSLRFEILSQMDTLSRGERDVFIFCLANNQRTIHRNITNADTHSLVSKRLLIRAAGAGSAMSWPHTIPTFVWKYIKKHEANLFPELYDESAMDEVVRRHERNSWRR